jgi:MFS family permease
MGRRRMLIVGAFLMAGAGFTFASTSSLLLLTIAGTIGVISPSGNEVGPFLSIEQAALSQVVPNRIRTSTFAWYTLAGAFATALGSLCGGILPQGAPENHRNTRLELPPGGFAVCRSSSAW